MSWKDGDEVNPGQAKKATDEMLADPKHKREKDSPDDLATVDDPLETPDEED
jgi:hypothetical protein